MTLNQPSTQVVSATIRGGSYADSNDQWTLETRAADNLEYNRRALLKFDTENTIPKGSAVDVGDPDRDREERQRRRVAHHRRLSDIAVLDRRRSDLELGAATVRTGRPPAATTARSWTTAVVSNVAGTKVTFDVTPLVKAAVAGDARLVALHPHRADGSRRLDVDVLSRVLRAQRLQHRGAPGAEGDLRHELRDARHPDLDAHHLAVHRQRRRRCACCTGTRTTAASASDGVWDPDRLVKWVAKFNPDVVSLNEVERNTGWSHNTDEPATFAALMKQYTGRTWYAKFQTLAGSAPTASAA